MTLTLTAAATVQPVSTDEAALQLRLSSAAEKTQLSTLLPVAVSQLRAELGRAFCYETWTLTLDSWWKDHLTLPVAPLSSVTSITYKDANNATQTWASSNYTVVKDSHETAGMGRLVLSATGSFPTVYAGKDVITVTFVAGYGAAATSVPAGLRLAVMLKAGELYDGQSNPLLDDLLAPFRIWSF